MDAAHVELVSPYWYGDRENNAAPDYLWKLVNNSVLTVIGGRIITDVANVRRPYKVGIGDVEAGSIVAGWYLNGETNMVTPLGGTTGFADNSNPPAGAIGECLEVTVNSGAAISLTTNNSTTLATIAATAGDWDQSGEVTIMCTGATITKIEVSMPGSGSGQSVKGSGYAEQWPTNAAGFTGNLTVTIPPFKNKLAAAGNEKMNVRVTFSAGTVAMIGHFRMRRIR